MNIECEIRTGWQDEGLITVGHNGDEYYLAAIDKTDENNSGMILITRFDVEELYRACVAILNAIPDEEYTALPNAPVDYYPVEPDFRDEILFEPVPEPEPAPKPKSRFVPTGGKTLAEALADGSIASPNGGADLGTVGEVTRR